MTRNEIRLLMLAVKDGRVAAIDATNTLCCGLNAAYARGAGHNGAATVLEPAKHGLSEPCTCFEWGYGKARCPVPGHKERR